MLVVIARGLVITRSVVIVELIVVCYLPSPFLYTLYTLLAYCHAHCLHHHCHHPCLDASHTHQSYTLYMSNMDVRSNQMWSTASTMTSWHQFHLTVTCKSVRKHLKDHGHHWKVLKHFIYVKYGCEKQSKVVYSLNHDITASFTLDSDPELPKSDLASLV